MENTRNPVFFIPRPTQDGPRKAVRMHNATNTWPEPNREEDVYRFTSALRFSRQLPQSVCATRDLGCSSARIDKRRIIHLLIRPGQNAVTKKDTLNEWLYASVCSTPHLNQGLWVAQSSQASGHNGQLGMTVIRGSVCQSLECCDQKGLLWVCYLPVICPADSAASLFPLLFEFPAILNFSTQNFGCN
jgi:hypothetical protein